MTQKYQVTFLLEGGTEIKHRAFMRPEGAIWYVKSAPSEAKRVRVEKLESKTQREFIINGHDDNANLVKEIEQYLGVAND